MCARSLIRALTLASRLDVTTASQGETPIIDSLCLYMPRWLFVPFVGNGVICQTAKCFIYPESRGLVLSESSLRHAAPFLERSASRSCQPGGPAAGGEPGTNPYPLPSPGSSPSAQKKQDFNESNSELRQYLCLNLHIYTSVSPV